MNNDKIGILDPLGINNNPLTDKPYSDEYKELAKKWSNFPVYKDINNVVRIIKDSQVVIVLSSTGSGKTVIIPKVMLHVLNYTGHVAITLPKQMIAKTSAEFAAKTLDVELGKEVGYQFRGSEKSSKSDKTRLLYATDGTIVARLMTNPKLSDFDAVIIDEAHERKVQIDFLLYLLRETLRLRPEFRLVIMSATINEKIFTDYFSEFKQEVINVQGERLYPIESIYLTKEIDPKDYLATGYNIIKKIITENKVKGDILFFVSSVSETETVCKRIEAKKEILNNYCIEVHAKITERKKAIAVDKSEYKTLGNYNRKIIIATNVAESSLTIDGIECVIDCGFELMNTYDPQYRAKRLNKVRITQAQVKQRMGRAGRTGAGICYHLYTEKEYNNMKQFPEPAIRINNIFDECLRLLYFPRVQTTEKLIELLVNFIEPPREEYIQAAITELYELQLIDKTQITALGKATIDLGGSNIKAAIGILASYPFNMHDRIIKIDAMINAIQNDITKLFIPLDVIIPDLMETMNTERTQRKKKEYYESKDKLKNKYGDHLALLNIFDKYDNKGEKARSDWCYKHYIKQNVMDNALKQYIKLKGNSTRNLRNIDMKTLSINFAPEVETLPEDIKILFFVLYGYRNQLAYSVNDNYLTPYTKNSDIKISINKETLMSGKLVHQMILYHELFMSDDKAELTIVSKIPDQIKKFKDLIL